MAIKSLDQPIHRSAQFRRGSYPIPLNSVTTAAFVGRTERGPVNEPFLIEGYPEYRRYFGGHGADGAVSHAVHDFFLHGGRRAVIVRVANRATRAQLELPAGDDVFRLQARYPGRHEILRVSVDYEQVEEDDCQFNLVIQRLGAGSNNLVEDQELYPLVSTRRSDSRFIGDILRDSRLVALAGAAPEKRPLATPPDRPGDPFRYVDLMTRGDDGDELTDYDIIGSDRDGTGLFALPRGPRIDLLSIPMPPDRELGLPAFVAAGWRTVDAALLGSRRIESASANVMTYFPRIRPRGARLRYQGGLPACGAIAGLLARSDQCGLWARREESDYSLRAALTPIVEVTVDEARRLARHGLNAFVHASGGATRLAGRVTMGAPALGAGERSSLERRRFGFFVLNSVEEASMAAAAEPELNASVARLEGQIRRFFDDLYLRGALKGATPAQSYYLHTRAGHCDIRFGISLYQAGRFVEYLIELDGPTRGRLQRVRAVEAEQLFS
jgi:hypothetical protein